LNHDDPFAISDFTLAVRVAPILGKVGERICEPIEQQRQKQPSGQIRRIAPLFFGL
jgi:hypothetical protein